MYKRAIREIYDYPSEYRNAEKKSDTDSDRDKGPDSPDPRLGHAVLISLAEKYDVPLQHVVPTFVALVLRDDPLTDDEAALLSVVTVCRLARAREQYFRKYMTNRLGPDERRNAAEKIVQVFSLSTTAKN